MGKRVIIVESPAKTRTIARFVGKDFDLQATMGHVRDLPEKKLGVDIEKGFAPEYHVLESRRAALSKIRQAVKGAEAVYLASDPDREGEAIAWHVAEALKLKDPKRIEFNEITRQAVEAALKHPRPIDLNRVNAQQARRVLDRLVGYKLSPLLQKRLGKWTLSAGRVQSVAVKLICDREREIEAFVPVEYWDVTALLTPLAEEALFEAKLVRKDGKKLELGPESETLAREALEALWDASYQVAEFRQSEAKRNPPPPFMTSTLQQVASQRLGFSPRQTMRLAQQLYEGLEIGAEGQVGLITYMRTDSVRVAAEAQQEARKLISERFESPYLPEKPPVYASRKSAQEGHEAIRPTSVLRDPESVKQYLDERQFRLYHLIWSRFLGSQMTPQVLDVHTAKISAGPYGLEARGIKIKFPGFTIVYPAGEKESFVPPLTEGEALSLLALSAAQKFTQPPPRYTEASLVKALEANGIGRPSTYAPIISTIQERGYVYLEDKKLRPTDLGFIVNDALVADFPEIINVEFTAAIEEKLDGIEEGKADWVKMLSEFYGPFSQSLEKATQNQTPLARPTRETEDVCEKCGKPMVRKRSRYGPFLACSGYPECKNTKRLSKSGEVVDTPPASAPEPTDLTCRKCGKPMVKRVGKRGPFIACSGFPKCRNILRSAEGKTESAKAAKDRPKPDPEPSGEVCDKCGKPMVVKHGRYGPFLGCSGYPECKNIKKLAKAP